MLLDTSAYSAVALGKSQILAALKGVPEVAVPLPVVAELRYGFSLGSREQENEDKLQRFLALPTIRIVVPDMETTREYALLSRHCRQSGKALAHNDLWIAALAKQHGLALVTYDRDFAAIERFLGDKLRILDD